MAIRVRAALVGGMILLAALAIPAAAASEVVTLDGARLAATRTRLQAGDAVLKPAFDALLRRADAALQAPLDTVVAKRLTPPSGDKHDYMSLGPYWWPDPAKPNGVPYRRKDGEINPSSKNDDTDSVRLHRLCGQVGDLALAYYFTGKEAYAAKAAAAIRTWFLDPATRMNPNLRYAQAIPGVVDGRGTGLIDTAELWRVIDAVGLVAPSGRLAAGDERALRQWFTDFTVWMTTSPQGHDEALAHNNHGTFYDAQLVDYALFTGQTELARRTVADAIHRRMASQIARDGRQSAELERTKSFHYSVFDLIAHLRLARYGEVVGVDYWNADQDGRSLKRGLDFLLPYLAQPNTWPYPDLEGVSPAVALPMVLQAARGWPNDAAPYRAALQAMPPSLQSDEAYLLWPLQ